MSGGRARTKKVMGGSAVLSSLLDHYCSAASGVCAECEARRSSALGCHEAGEERANGTMEEAVD